MVPELNNQYSSCGFPLRLSDQQKIYSLKISKCLTLAQSLHQGSKDGRKGREKHFEKQE